MKKMVFLLALFLITVMVTSCAGIKSKIRGDGDNASANRPKKEKVVKEKGNQTSAADIEIFWGDEKPTRPYKGIGRASVQKFGGISPFPRSSDACIEGLKKQAAKKGGDGIINITEDFASMSGTIIRFTESDKAKPPAE